MAANNKNDNSHATIDDTTEIFKPFTLLSEDRDKLRS
jgi:hypothetical protein